MVFETLNVLVFTVATKNNAPFFAFDESAILWAIFSSFLIVSLCLLCAISFDCRWLALL